MEIKLFHYNISLKKRWPYKRLTTEPLYLMDQKSILHDKNLYAISFIGENRNMLCTLNLISTTTFLLQQSNKAKRYNKASFIDEIDITKHGKLMTGNKTKNI